MYNLCFEKIILHANNKYLSLDAKTKKEVETKNKCFHFINFLISENLNQRLKIHLTK